MEVINEKDENTTDNESKNKKPERIVITIDPELKRLLKLVLIFEESNFTNKINELIEAYVDERIEQIKPKLEQKES